MAVEAYSGLQLLAPRLPAPIGDRKRDYVPSDARDTCRAVVLPDGVITVCSPPLAIESGLTQPAPPDCGRGLAILHVRPNYYILITTRWEGLGIRVCRKVGDPGAWVRSAWPIRRFTYLVCNFSALNLILLSYRLCLLQSIVRLAAPTTYLSPLCGSNSPDTCPNRKRARGRSGI